jgi:hypothetical protein
MRKLLWLGGAAALAYVFGKGKTGQARDVAARDGRRGIGVRDIVEVMVAPRWLRPVLLVRALTNRRQPRREA